jgi:exonuclease SbcD
VRLIHVADLHLGLTRYGFDTPTGNTRVADFTATLNHAVDAAIEREAEMFVLAGDTFNSRRPGPLELEAVVAALRRLSVEHGIASVVIPGNHDGMTTIGDPRTHALNWLAAAGLPDVHVLTTPGTHRIEKRGRWGATVFALPYPHKRAFDTLRPDLTPEERVVEIGKRVTDAIATLAIRTDGEPFIFVGHATVLGAKAGAEATMRIGWDVSITPEVLDRFDYAALGHIHRHQKVGTRGWYAGSPEYIDFAEAGTEKGFLLVDIGPEGPAVEMIPSGARPFVDIEMSHADAPLPEDLAGAVVRIRIHAATRLTPRQVNAVITEARARGASYVKTEVRLDAPAEVQEREAVAEGDTVEAVRQWLASRGHPEEPTTSIAREMIASLAGQE